MGLLDAYGFWAAPKREVPAVFFIDQAKLREHGLGVILGRSARQARSVASDAGLYVARERRGRQLAAVVEPARVFRERSFEVLAREQR